MLALGGSDPETNSGLVEIVEVATGQVLARLTGPTESSTSLAWAPDCSKLAAAGTDNHVCVWDVAALGPGKAAAAPYAIYPSFKFDTSPETTRAKADSLYEPRTTNKTLFVHDLTWDPDSHLLAVGTSDSAPVVFGMGSDQPIHKRYSFSAGVKSLIWFAKNRLVVAEAANPSETVLLDTSRWEVITSSKGAPCQAVAYSDRLGLIALARPGAIEIFDRDLKLRSRLEIGASRIGRLNFSHDSSRLMVLSESGAAVFWTTENWQIECELPLAARIAAYHPSKQIIATIEGSKHHAKLWEYETELYPISSESSERHVCAKVVLVGESNVGKSYLAHRLINGKAPNDGEIASTHGLRLWRKPVQTPRGVPAAARREMVLWDFGGQHEYRLVHQLFIRDTTLALVLFDPTRGAAAFKEVEGWCNYLEKQFGGPTATKILVGTKVDQPSAMIDRQAIDRLKEKFGFRAYVETSALKGQGISVLNKAIAEAIDWEQLAVTTRTSVVGEIRRRLEKHRQRGEVVLLFDELREELNRAARLQLDKSGSPDWPAFDAVDALDAVCTQLSQQGIVVDTKTQSGSRALVLQVDQVERYAGSLILAARDNPRGVPALELNAVANSQFSFPGLDSKRLPPADERRVVECTIQLMLENGICFQHGGLLVFPSLFDSITYELRQELPEAVSLYYDFSGAVDNIYASLVAWLVIAQDFGRVRLWPNGAEFEVSNDGKCGISKVTRPGGFAHVDVYFGANTSPERREEFISFVEDHLSQQGVEIHEHLGIKCACGNSFPEEVIRRRIALGSLDVLCSVCEQRHLISTGAEDARLKDPRVSQATWALRTKIQQMKQEAANIAVRKLESAADAASSPGDQLYLLHLSDMHFQGDTLFATPLQWLLDDLRNPRPAGLGINRLDYIVVSGDFIDKGNPQGFDASYRFLLGLCEAMSVSAERCILIPGNHDLVCQDDNYVWKKTPNNAPPDRVVQQGSIFLVRNDASYPNRFRPFSELLYHQFLQRPYPLNPIEQGISIPFLDDNLQFITLNSCGEIDEFHRKRAGLDPDALAHAIRQSQDQIRLFAKGDDAAQSGRILKIAVWHHSITGDEQMPKTSDLIGNLLKNGVKIALHGDIHRMERNEVRNPFGSGALNVIGAGSFGARSWGRPESVPRLYNLLEIRRDLTSIRVHTREQRTPNGAWQGWHEWENPNGEGRLPYYDLQI